MGESQGDEFYLYLRDIVSDVETEDGHHPALTNIGGLLCTPVRRRLVDYFLSEGLRGKMDPRPMTKIAEDVDVGRKSLSENIEVLEQMDIVSQARDGRKHMFKPNINSNSLTTLVACTGGLREYAAKSDADISSVGEDETVLSYLFKCSARRRLCEVCMIATIADVERAPLNKSEWAEMAGVSRVAVGTHLPVLEAFDLVEENNEGNHVRYVPNVSSSPMKMLVGAEDALTSAVDQSGSALLQ